MKDAHLLVKSKIMQSLHYLNRTPSTEQKASISKADVEILINTINSASNSTFAAIVQILKQNGHISMGFKSPTALLIKKTDLGASYISRNISAATIYLDVEKDLDNLSFVSEATFRPLIENDVDLETSKKVWAKVLQLKPSNRIKASHVRNAMQALGIKAKPTKKPIESIDAQLQWTVSRYVKKLSACMTSVKTEAEWNHVAKIVYKSLLQNCPIQKQNAA